ncbi:carbon-nitrogen hydrolase family protein [Rhizobium sp. L245/93]|uniref:carbon-nitrogen hydrolase family protein n=1 Tax=Rhizobium sp. L245/93 TaxID=2819998 RepID=UPI001ADC64FB|nr:carbon-nitrogen hydrolase family protein [Rhizobium sp. L245/93]
MKVAAAQTEVSADISKNAEIIKRVLSQAASEGARLVNFCEGALSGYSKMQIASPDDWVSFDWERQEAELKGIADLCGKLGIFAVVGGAHRLTVTHRPHNSLYIFSDRGTLLTRYDKRFLSHSENADWYTPGRDPIIFEVNGYRFGCAICIEAQFYEVFVEYERLDVDAVLFSSYGLPGRFQIALRAHASLNCLWIIAATPAQRSEQGPAGILGPDGKWVTLCPTSGESTFVLAELDRAEPAYEVPMKLARPGRRLARLGDIYRERMADDPRSFDREQY